MLRQGLRASQRSVAAAAPCRRFLNTETAPNLYSVRAKVVGARTGYVHLPPAQKQSPELLMDEH